MPSTPTPGADADIAPALPADFPEAPLWVAAAARLLRLAPAGRYRLMNRLAPRAAADGPFWSRAPRALGGWAFLCDPRDSVAREACFLGRYEPQETALVRTLLRPGDLFVDVGANWGYFTLLAADAVGPRGAVLALEPDPRLFRVLRGNVERNALAHVRLEPLAASDREGETRLDGYDERGGNFGLSRLAAPRDDSPSASPESESDSDSDSRFRVRTRPLDDLLDDWPPAANRPIRLLKMDIEGAEAIALPGLRRALSAGRIENLLIELHPEAIARFGSTVETLLELPAANGYALRAIDHAPDAARRAAYGRSPDPTRFLVPLDPANLGPWPHILATRAPESRPAT